MIALREWPGMGRVRLQGGIRESTSGPAGASQGVPLFPGVDIRPEFDI